MTKPRLVGINHVALEVDDVDAATAWPAPRGHRLQRRGGRIVEIDLGANPEKLSGLR